MKKFFIIPGFKERANDSQYKWLISHIKKAGWTPVTVPITWNRKTVSQNANDFVTFYNEQRSEQNQVLGFSYGAVIALLTAGTLGPRKLYLCSLSPDFKEDQDKISPSIRKYIGKKRFKDIETRSAIKIAKNLSVPTTIFYGEVEGEEYPSLKNRCEETAKHAQHAELVVIPDTPHKIDFIAYQDAIKMKLIF
ncbi:MAG: hypothetical protein KBB54_02285 [Candidatus Pacebacteria bacterium]|nr:hypothetical protein [Candidatus Paceibacterota bacterium]MBP9843052.1 hypothetical protein [Candidatus Paceibacterota bacterium]